MYLYYIFIDQRILINTGCQPNYLMNSQHLAKQLVYLNTNKFIVVSLCSYHSSMDNLCLQLCIYQVITKSMAEAPDAPKTPFGAPYPEGRVVGLKLTQKPSPPWGPPLCQKNSDPFSSLDFYREHRHIKTYIALNFVQNDSIEVFKM